MVLKTLMKNPILMIGIISFSLFIYYATSKGKLGRREALMPTSCKALRVKLDRRIPANWKSECEGNNLAVEITLPREEKVLDKDLSAYLYRHLANDMISIAKNSPSDNLERTDFVRVRINHPDRQINALTEGKYLTKLATMKDKRLIAEHLKLTVQVQEITK